MAVRKTPTIITMPGGVDGSDYGTDVDVEIEALWARSAAWLNSVAGTAAGTITATADVTLFTYAKNNAFWLVPDAANTGACTINIDGVGANNLLDLSSNALVAGALASGALTLIVYDGTAFRLLIQAAATAPTTKAPDIIVQDQKSSGTAGGSFVSGAWQTRTLNTVVRNVQAGASLASNALTLPAGSYYAKWRAPAEAVQFHKTRLRNSTDNSVIALGSNSRTNGNFQTDSQGEAVFTISSAKAFVVEHWCTSTENTDGFGAAASIGGVAEIYTDLQVWKTG